MTERIAKPEHIAVAPGEPPIVDVQGLWTQFGKGSEVFTVHQDLNFTVQRGEILSLVGGSGTGKTVLLRQILGLARPARGSVTVKRKVEPRFGSLSTLMMLPIKPTSRCAIVSPRPLPP